MEQRISISTATSTFVHSDMIYEQHCGSIYYWNAIFLEFCEKKSKNSLRSMITSFKSSFYSLPQDRPEIVIDLCNGFGNCVIDQYSNLEFNIEKISHDLLDLYNAIHSDIISLKISGLNSILNNVESLCKFKKIHSRFLRSDLELEQEKSSFISETITLKNFSLKIISEKFIEKLKCFIQEFNQEMLTQINRFIEAIVDIHEKKAEKIKENAMSLFDDILGINAEERLVKFQILISEVRIGEKLGENNYEIAFEDVFVQETIVLKQVLSLNLELAMASLGFVDSKKLLFIVFQRFRAVKLTAELVDDCETMIASGSNQESLVFIKETQKICVIGMLTQELKLIITRKIDLGKFLLCKIVSVCFVRQSDDLIWINSKGNLNQINLAGYPKDVLPHFFTEKCEKIQKSQCDNFIKLTTANSLFILSNDFSIKASENIVALYTQIENCALSFICLDDSGVFYEVKKEINSDLGKNYKEKLSAIKNKVSYITKSTFYLGKELFGGMFKQNNYRHNDFQEKMPEEDEPFN